MVDRARGGRVLIDSAALVQAFEELGEYELADEARQLLPERLDTDRHRELFLQFGIEPRDLLRRAGATRPGRPG